MAKYNIDGLNYASIELLIRSLLKEKGISYAELAKSIKIRRPTVERWLNGSSIPSILACRRLASFGKISLVRILSLTNHLPRLIRTEIVELIEYRTSDDESSREDLDEDLNTMIEDLIERGILKERHSSRSNKI